MDGGLWVKICRLSLALFGPKATTLHSRPLLCRWMEGFGLKYAKANAGPRGPVGFTAKRLDSRFLGSLLCANPKTLNPTNTLKEPNTPSPKPRARMEGHAEVHGSGSHRRLDECISKPWVQGLGLEGLGVIGFGGLGFRVQLFFVQGLQGFLVH